MAKSRKPPQVSDHAVLRYLQRVKGLDVDAVREEILTPAVHAAIRAGATRVSVEGVEFVVSDGVVTTAMKRSGRVHNGGVKGQSRNRRRRGREARPFERHMGRDQ